MPVSNRLALPLLDAAQAQKHVTHNQALIALDALVQLSVSARNVLTPPATPAEGDRVLIGNGASGAFAGQDGALASFDGGGWSFVAPRSGWRLYVAAERTLLIFDGTTWIAIDALLRALQNLTGIGLGTTSDATNKLAAKLNAALFTALGTAESGTGDLRMVLNKSAAANTVSQLYQNNYSGRAETGLAGDDKFRVKVSADGSAWRDALSIDPATAQPTFAWGIAAGDRAGFRNRLRNASFAISQRPLSGTVTLAAGVYGHDGVKAGANGATYTFAKSGLDTTLTISAGSLIMPIEDATIEGGTYLLAHDGTAPARVWQGTGSSGSGSYANAVRSAGGLVLSGLSGATQTNVEFSTGTIVRPQFEPGVVATTFERRPPGIELALCQRYYQAYLWAAASNFQFTAYASAGGWPSTNLFLGTPFRVQPTVGFVGTWSSWNASTIGISPSGPSIVTLYFNAAATGSGGMASPANGGFYASAEI